MIANLLQNIDIIAVKEILTQYSDLWITIGLLITYKLIKRNSETD